MEPYQISKNYYARFTFLGRQCTFSLRTTNKKVADKILEQIQIGLERGTFDAFEKGSEGERILRLLIARPGLRIEEALEEIHSTTKRKSLKEAIEEYLANCKTEHSMKNYVNELRVFNYFSEFVKVNLVHQVTPELIEKYRNARVETVSKSTANRELKMIKRFFRQSLEKGYLPKSPAEKLKVYKEPELQIRHLSDDEISRILEVAPKDLQNIITVFLFTGMRYGELCHLEWSDVDFRHKQLVVQPKEHWKPKSLKKRIIPIHPIVEDVLRNLPRKDDVNYVFPDWDGDCAEGGLRNRLYLVFGKAKVKCNVKDLRSTFASNAVMQGLPIYTVSKLLGHHDVKITEKHYAHLAPDYMGNAITMLQPKWEIKQLEKV